MTPQERAQFIADIAAALSAHSAQADLTDDEVHSIKLLIKRQEQSLALRSAIIEKSLVSLVWMAIVGVGYTFYAWAQQHGFKP